MATKLHRGKKNMFRRRNTGWIKVVLTVVACAALIGLGILLAMAVSDTPDQPDTPDTGETASSSTTTTATTTTTSTQPAPAPNSARRAIYITTAQLKDTAALEILLTQASAAGCNSVVFDLKDADGAVWYTAETALAAKAGSVSADALTKEQLQDVAALCRAKGMEPIPRLFAFRDKTAPLKLTDARVKLEGNSGIIWLDRKKSEGGKSWLNPCSEAAWEYVLGLCTELKGMGFTAQLLEGVQFPEKDSRSDYGNGELAQLEKKEVLARFVKQAQETVGDGLIVSVSGLSALGSDTAGYQGNPLTFGMAVAAPRLPAAELGNTLSFNGETVTPASDPAGAVTLALKQMASYGRIMNLSVTLMPWVDAGTPAQVLEAQSVTSYILYSETGTYSF